MDRLCWRVVYDLEKHGRQCSSTELAERLNVSSKTILKLISDNRETFLSCGFDIISTSGKGLELSVLDHYAFDVFWQDVIMYAAATQGGIYAENSDIFEIALLLITRSDGITADELKKALYVSASTLYRRLRKAEEFFGWFHVSILKGNSQYRLEGKEYNRRMAAVFLLKDMPDISGIGDPSYMNTAVLYQIRNAFSKILQKYEVVLMDSTFHQFCIYAMVSGLHHRRGQYLETGEDCGFLRKTCFCRIAEELYQWMMKAFSEFCSFDEEEILCLGILLAVSFDEMNPEEFEKIDLPSGMNQEAQRIYGFVDEHLNRIYSFGIPDCMDSYRFSACLKQIALLFSSGLDLDIRTIGAFYSQSILISPLCLKVSSEICQCIEDNTGKQLPMEIFLDIANLIHSKLFQIEIYPEKKDILLVSGSGRTAAQQMEMILESVWKEEINSVNIKAAYEIQEADVERADLVLSDNEFLAELTIPYKDKPLHIIDFTNLIRREGSVLDQFLRTYDSLEKYLLRNEQIEVIEETEKMDLPSFLEQYSQKYETYNPLDERMINWLLSSMTLKESFTIFLSEPSEEEWMHIHVFPARSFPFRYVYVLNLHLQSDPMKLKVWEKLMTGLLIHADGKRMCSEKHSYLKELLERSM